MSTKYIAPYKGIRFLESGELFPVESGIRKIIFLLNPESWVLESETKLKESGIHYYWNPKSELLRIAGKSGIQNLESRIQDCGGFSYRGR